MNCKQVNDYSIKPLLALLGIEPVRKSGAGYLYSAKMYREDNNPSLYVVDNRWKDLSTAEHGRTLDLFSKIFKASIPETLTRVESLVGGNPSRIILNSNPIPQARQSQTEIRKICPLQNQALVEYLAVRGIPVDIAKKYVKEIYLSHQGRNHFYIGLLNDSGGYSLRNKYLKRNVGASDISVFHGDHPGLAIYEGMFDFLSALRISDKARLVTSIVLNSTANTQKAIDKISAIAKPDFEIALLLDSDDAGRKCATIFQKKFPNAIDCSWVYSKNNCKDLNEYLMKLKMKTILK